MSTLLVPSLLEIIESTLVCRLFVDLTLNLDPRVLSYWVRQKYNGTTKSKFLLTSLLTRILSYLLTLLEFVCTEVFLSFGLRTVSFTQHSVEPVHRLGTSVLVNRSARK